MQAFVYDLNFFFLILGFNDKPLSHVKVMLFLVSLIIFFFSFQKIIKKKRTKRLKWNYKNDFIDFIDTRQVADKIENSISWCVLQTLVIFVNLLYKINVRFDWRIQNILIYATPQFVSVAQAYDFETIKNDLIRIQMLSNWTPLLIHRRLFVRSFRSL